MQLRVVEEPTRFDSILEGCKELDTFAPARSPWKCTVYPEHLVFQLESSRYVARALVPLRKPIVCHFLVRTADLSVQELFAYPIGQLVASSVLAILGNGLVVHSACALHEDRGYVFCGASGAGKSTLASLLDVHQGFRVLGDDRAVIYCANGQVMVSGSPWAGTAGIMRSGESPLSRIFLLSPADSNFVVPLPAPFVAARLFQMAFPTFWYRPGMEFALEFCIRVATEVPCRVFGFRPDRSAAEFLVEELQREVTRC